MNSAIVFDLDGTLVDSRQDLMAAVSFVLSELGYPHRTKEEIVSFVGHGVRHLVKSSLPSAAGLDPARLDSALELFNERYQAHLADETRPYPGVVEALETLHQRGVPAWVLTNKPGAMARLLVRTLELDHLFGGILGAGDVPAHKPDPAGLLEVCRRLGLAPAAVWYVGDMALDVHTARAAGCRAALATWGYRGEEPLREVTPDRILRDPAELAF